MRTQTRVVGFAGSLNEKFDDEGRLTDERTRPHLGKFLRAFVDWISRFR